MLKVEKQTLRTSDGVTLAVTVFEPSTPTRSVLIGSAMGVPRGFYSSFAQFLATKGYRVLTLDYRSMGQSEVIDDARLSDWGELDLQAGLDSLQQAGPNLPLHFIGHSVGGQLFGLIADDRIRSAVLIASQSGYWRHWDGLWRLRIIGLWFGVIPATSRLVGRLPARFLGGGEDIPGGVAAEWARWGRHPGYIQSYAKRLPKSGFSTFSGPIRALAFPDDPMAPERAVRALLGCFEQTTPELQMIHPTDLGLTSIGHFGAFRPAARALWDRMLPVLEEEIRQT